MLSSQCCVLSAHGCSGSSSSAVVSARRSLPWVYWVAVKELQLSDYNMSKW